MINVLVVDDDFRVARIHCGFVERVPGFAVVGSVHTGRDALDAVRELRPDLVLLDLYLPDVFGLDVLAELRSSAYDCDVLVISAAKEADAVRGAVRSGIVNYLLKPFGFDDLQLRLKQYAAQRTGLYAAELESQADIDRALSQPARSATQTLPKGLSPETAALVEQAVRDAAVSLSAAECADRTGISRVSARRYLEFLHATGAVTVSLRYAQGRPERRYQWVSDVSG
ncbi:response regulator [Cryptosporangium sp. NPDC048952]|uniref:response regulator n=1 Tax=Cryptosporangium sp. NPDC048952 TaxID=3363961 RepID=UPI003721321A